MLNRHITKVLIILLALLFVTCHLPIDSQGSSPRSVMGIIYDLADNPVMDVVVYINNTATNESLNFVTDEFGRYSINIDANIADILAITAIHHHLRANGTLDVSPAPYDQLDLILDFYMHIIDGYILKPDGSPANHFAVNVANMDSNESRYTPSALNGYYRMDIGAYVNGYAVNEDICVSVNFKGFNASNISVVSTNLYDMINITLIDNDNPAPYIQEAPASVNINQDFKILVWVAENHTVDSTTLSIKKSDQSLFTEIIMIRDDGLDNDWNGDGMATVHLFGQSTSIDLDVQTDLGDLLFYVMAYDFSGNTGTFPVASPLTNPLRIEVIDPIAPFLVHTPITTLEGGITTDIVAIALDNIGMDSVNMYVKNVSQVDFTEYLMVPNGNPNEFNATMPAQYALGTLEYYVLCNDTSNNTVRLPASGSWSVDIVDTTAPKIVHSAINSVNVDDPVNFTCQISEAIGLDSVWLNFTDVHYTNFNVSMIDAGSGNWYYLNASGMSITGQLYYKIWVNDTSGNMASFTHIAAVNDAGTPLIFHDAPAHLNFNETTNITAHVEDNVAISGVSLAYEPVGGTNFTVIDMQPSFFNGTHGDYYADIPSQLLGSMRYYINATDGTNNISWPAIGPPNEVDVLDLEPPVLIGAVSLSIRYSPGDVTVFANVTDNHMVGQVNVHYLNSTSESWNNVSMVPVGVDATGSGIYEGIIPGHVKDIVWFYYSANDTSGNNVTCPELDPKLNPLYLIFLDYSTPAIELYAPESIAINTTTEIVFNATDDQEVVLTELYLNGTEDGTFTSLPVTKLENGSYKGILPPQSLSGDIQIYATATDGVNNNQTDIFSIPVINQPPEIQHIGVESAPVGENVAMVAQITDDLHVENVILSWKPIDESQYSNLTMDHTGLGTYIIDLSFEEAIIIQYHITAFDAENSTVWPDGPDHEISIMDLEAPTIIHEPLVQLNISSMPIISASVSDNMHVSSVTLWYKNASASTFFSSSMSPVSNIQDSYAVVLGQQPEGNFTYYIEAADGINTAETERYTLEVVDSSGTDWTSIIMLIVVIILLVIAAIIVMLHLRRKPIKEVVNPQEK